MTDAWTVATLKDALEGAFDEGEANISFAEAGDTLLLVFPDHGDLEVTVTVAGDQMLASTLLWPRAAQADTASFEEESLRTHKFLPLSTFGITSIDDEDWYELFGALSAHSSIEDIRMELRFLGTNAVQVAQAQLDAAPSA